MASAASLLLPFPSHFSVGTRKCHNDAAFPSPVRKRHLQIRASVTATGPTGLKLSEPHDIVPMLPEIESADPDFYRIGYMRNMRAYELSSWKDLMGLESMLLEMLSHCHELQLD